MTNPSPAKSELIADWRLLAFGTLASLASAPGQTLVISLFNENLREAFSLTHAGLGSLYMVATLASAAVILWTGKAIDRFDLRLVFALTTLGLCVACLIAGSATHTLTLLLALFLLRHFGQGLMSHISVTSVNRYYQSVRGKASAIVNQGFTLAEAVLPITISALIIAIGWRHSWYVLGIICIAVVLPVLLLLISDHRRRHGHYLDRMSVLEPDADVNTPARQKQWTRADMLRDWRFYGVIPVVIAPSFLNTGLMFHHQHITAAKGWPLQTWYLLLTTYAATSVVSSLVAGAIVDKRGARLMMSIFCLPLALGGLCLMGGASTFWTAATLMAFGSASGMTAAVTGPFWAEVYGVLHLGAIKAVATAVMIFASALSPALYGLMFNANVSMTTLGAINAAFALGACLSAYIALRKP